MEPDGHQNPAAPHASGCATPPEHVTAAPQRLPNGETDPAPQAYPAAHVHGPPHDVSVYVAAPAALP